MSPSARIRLSALIVFLGIALGAFGAHGLADRLAETGRADNWETATFYHLLHGVALFALSLHSRIPRDRPPFGFWCFVAGIVLFSGSLYLLALTDIAKLGAITPIGGVSFLVGWGRWIFFRNASNDSSTLSSSET